MTVIRAAELDRSADALASAALALARRFADGATLWCVAPGAEHHARHVAVEFVHPVIVGTRSLPAVALEATDPIAAARSLVRSGDVVLAIGVEEDTVLDDLMRRTDAWGATAIRIVSSEDPDVVLAYHLLWELTHVAFGHPGLLDERTASDAECRDDVCITCSDEARVAEIRTVLDGDTALAVTAGAPVELDVSLVGPVAPGDLVLTHAGTALSVVGAPTSNSEEPVR